MPVRTQITIVFAAILLISFIFNFVINNVYLEDYYFKEKEYILRNVFVLLDEPEANSTELYQTCKVNNISILSLSPSLEEEVHIAISDNNANNSEMFYRLQYLMGYEFEESIVAGSYHLIRVFDESTKTYYLEMFGLLSDNSYFLIKTPVSSIMDSLTTINQFSYFSFILCICLGIILINTLSNIITYPIEKLSSISKKMSNFDFSELHTSSKLKEVDELGNTLNHLSLSLNHTMNELKEANAKLEKDIEEKIHIDDMRKEFISNVSHELKTPIAIIQGYAEVLNECESDEDRDFYCGVIVDEAHKMDTMVKQLIELNKLEFGMDDSVITNVQLNKLIEKVVKNLDVLAPDIDFQIISKENVYVLFDEFKLEQIITNYLTNAIHYVDDRKQIRIRIEDGDKVKLSIFNTGTHISDDNLKRIWEKFYKIDKARTRSYGGSGIGLSIISAIMRKYGEDFGCENVQDGVEFYVYLRKQ